MKPPVVGPLESLAFTRPALETSPLAHHIEALGLFLRNALPTNPSLDADVVHAVERMAEDCVAPPQWVLDALGLHVDAVVARLITDCSPLQLCVLSDTLRSLHGYRPTLAPLGTDLTHAVAATSDVALQPTVSYYGNLLDQLKTAVLTAADDSLRLAFDGDAVVLRPRVMGELTAARHCQHAARMLLLASLPLLCVQQLQEMAVTGRCMSLEAVEQLTSEGSQEALMLAFQQLKKTTLHELMLTMSRAATATSNPKTTDDVLLLWTAVQSAAERCGRKSSLCVGTRPTLEADETAPERAEIEIEIIKELNHDTTPKQADVQQFALMIQPLRPFLSLDQHTQDEITLAAHRGFTLSHDALTDLTTHWDSILLLLPLRVIHQLLHHLHRLVQDSELGDDYSVLLHHTQLVAVDATHTSQALTPQPMEFYAAQQQSTQRIVRRLEIVTTAQRRRAKAAGDAWSSLDTAAIDVAYDEAALGAGCSAPAATTCVDRVRRKLPSLAKFEIVRDFAQVTSLVFTNLYTVALANAPLTVTSLQQSLISIQVYLRGLANFCAADFTAVLMRYSGAYVDVVPDVLFAGLLLVIVVACSCLGVLALAVAMQLDTNDPKVERTPVQVTWLRRPTLSIRTVTIVLTLCQSVHLPVARLCMEILTGVRTTSSVYLRYGDQWFWRHLHTAAIILLIGYVGGLIVLLFLLIHRNAPRVAERPLEFPPSQRTSSLSQRWQRLTTSDHLTIVDLDGTPVAFRNSVYAEILARDPTQLRCPYRSLYVGFERRWRFYKVVQLTIKLVLTMLLIPIHDPHVRALTTLGVTTLSFVSTWTAPFIDDGDDAMELSAKGTAVVTCVGGVVLAYDPEGDAPSTRGISAAVTLVNLLNGLVMVGLTIAGSDSAKAWFKGRRTQLTFRDSQRYAGDKAAKEVLPAWDCEYELRHRVWHAFWKRTLLALDQHAVIQRLAHAKIEEERVAAQQRKETWKKQEMHGERETLALAQRRHWLGEANERVAAVRILIKRVLAGSDVVYESADGVRGFGRLSVVAYPFHCVFQHDTEKKRIRIQEDADVARLLFTNFRCDVRRRRIVRQQLRALSAWGQSVALPYAREEPWTASKPKAATTFRCCYTQGVIRVDPASDKGFALSIAFSDGTGEIVGPTTHKVLNRCAVVAGDAALALLGLSPTFDNSSTFREILSRPEVADALAHFLPDIQEIQETQELQETGKRPDKDSILSSGFRFVVYNNPHLSRRALEHYLTEVETNATLQQLPSTHRAALDLLYEQLRFIGSDRRAAFWFLFWHDVYEQNSNDIQIVYANKLALDPKEATSIAYNVMPREALQRWLKRRGLWGEWWFLGMRWRTTLFHRELLELLYDCMEKQTTEEGGEREEEGRYHDEDVWPWCWELCTV